MGHKDKISMQVSGGDQLFHHHIEHCTQCTADLTHPCQEGRETLERAVEEGSNNSFNRTLYQAVTGKEVPRDRS